MRVERIDGGLLAASIEGTADDAPEASDEESQPDDAEGHRDTRGDGTIMPDDEGDPTLTLQPGVMRSGRFEDIDVEIEIDATDGEYSIAEKLLAKKRIEAEKNAASSNFNKQIKALETEIDELSIGIQTGTIKKKQRCEVVFNWTTGQAEYYEAGPNGELGAYIRSRYITPEEREQRLRFEEDRHLDDQEGNPDGEHRPEREQLALPIEGDLESEGEKAANLGKCNACGGSWDDDLGRSACPWCESKAISYIHAAEKSGEQLTGDVTDDPDVAVGEEGQFEEAGIEEIESMPDGEEFFLGGRQVKWIDEGGSRYLADVETGEETTVSEAILGASDEDLAGTSQEAIPSDEVASQSGAPSSEPVPMI